ncbi:hypothetical protein C8R47DRAFT_1254393, partial [Mycena vitilis]
PPPVQPVRHPCYQNPRPASRLKPEVTFTLKHIRMCAEKIPASYPYALLPIDGLYRNTGLYEFVPVPLFEFCGTGTPLTDIGTPGDVYMDLTPGAHALYITGPASLSHQHFVEGFEWRQRAGELEPRVDDYRDGPRGQGAFGAPVQAPPSPTLSAMSVDDLFASESECESDALSDFYPSKRARLLASGGDSVIAGVSPRRAKAPPAPPRNPAPADRETAQLEKTFAALQANKK